MTRVLNSTRRIVTCGTSFNGKPTRRVSVGQSLRAVSRRAAALLRPGGTLVLEHGDEQGAAIRQLLEADGWRSPVTTPDLLGRDRATSATR